MEGTLSVDIYLEVDFNWSIETAYVNAEDTTEVYTKDLDFFVYPFSKKETITVQVIPDDCNK